MNVVVLGGGDSPERGVSLRSARSVTVAAHQAGFNIEEADPKEGLSILDGVASSSVVLPILHGAGGEDGSLQAELERRGLPFLGSGSQSSKQCFDKWQTRQAIASCGLPIAEGELVTAQTYSKSPLHKRPHVLKVNHGGSSIGTLIVRQPGNVSQKAIDQVFELDNRAVIEKLIEGAEVTVAILDSSALPVVEIVPPPGGEFDYDNKYNGQTRELCPPVSIKPNVQKKVQALAEEVHKTMSCRHLSRVDIMIDSSDSLFVLEINTIPGLTDQSLYPKAAQVSGLGMPQLVRRFINMVARDYSL